MCRRQNTKRKHEFSACRFDVLSPAKMRKMKLTMSGTGAATGTIDEPHPRPPVTSLDAMVCMTRSGKAGFGGFPRCCIFSPLCANYCTRCMDAHEPASWPWRTPLCVSVTIAMVFLRSQSSRFRALDPLRTVCTRSHPATAAP